MSILLACITAASIACSLFYGVASIAHLNLYEDHKNYFKKGYGSQKTHKLFMRYNLLCYRHTIKKSIASLLITIISLLLGYSTL